MAIEPRGLDTYAAIIVEGSWEPWVLRPMRAALQGGGVLYDVGANVGYMTIEGALLPNTSVVAFEPQPELAIRVALSASLSNCQNVSVYCAALGATAGEATLHVPPHNLHASVSSGVGGRNVRCPQVRLDDLVEAESLPPPTVIKVDVEGAELDVFRGAEATLRRWRPILLFEENGSGQAFGYDRQELLAWLQHRADYRFFAIGSNDIIAATQDHMHLFSGYFPRIA